MHISTATKVVTTRTHTAVIAADEVKAAAMLLAKRNTGLGDDAIASMSVTLAADGSATVEIVEHPSESVEVPPVAAAEAPAAPEGGDVQAEAAHAVPAPAAATHPSLSFGSKN